MDYWKRFFTTENDFWPQKRVWGLFQVLNTRKITPSMSSQLVDCFKKRFSHMWNDFYIATSDKTGTEAMRGPNFTTGWAFPRCARRRVFVQAGVPLFGTSWGMRHVRICGCTCIYMAFLPRNCGFQYAKSPSTCAATRGPLWRALVPA